MLTVCLTLSVASVGLLSNDLWLTGHELEPGVKVLDGLFSASEVHPVMGFHAHPDTADNTPPDFQQLKAMNILVHNTKKKASIGHSTCGFLLSFRDTLQHTVDTICSALSAFDSLFCQSQSAQLSSGDLIN